MKVASIDNSASADIDRVITWQFDKATNLIGVLSLFKDFFKQSTQDAWDLAGKRLDITKIDNADDFTLSIWGKLLGIPRPLIRSDEDDPSTAEPMSSALYRKILIARFRLANTNASVQAYRDFVSYIFGNTVAFIDGEDESISFVFQKTTNLTDDEKEMRNAIQQVPDAIFAYPAGVKSSDQDNGPVFGFAEQVRPKITSADGQTVDVGYQQTVGTSVIVRISGTAGTKIPTTAKFTNNGNDYVIEDAVTIGDGGYVDAKFIYGGKDYVKARSVYALSGIGNITVKVTNIGRSITDFTIAGLDESTIAWNRESVREINK